MCRNMSWEADIHDDNDPVEEDVFEDGEEFDVSDADDPPPPAKKKTRCSKKKGEMRGAKTTRWRHLLNKSEKKNVVAHISSTSNEEITLKSLSNAAKTGFSC